MISILDENTSTVKPLLTRDQVAEYLGITVRQLIRETAPRGQLPCIRIGRRVLYDQIDLAGYVAARRVS